MIRSVSQDKLNQFVTARTLFLQMMITSGDELENKPRVSCSFNCDLFSVTEKNAQVLTSVFKSYKSYTAQ